MCLVYDIFIFITLKARSVDREKTAHVNRITLNFRESEKEKSYHQDFDFGFTMSMGTSLLLLILSAGLQVGFMTNPRVVREIMNCFLFQIGFRPPKDFDPSAPISNRIHLDLSHSHAHNGCTLEMDLLGRCAKLFTKTCDNCVHHNSRLFRWANECRKLIYMAEFCDPFGIYH